MSDLWSRELAVGIAAVVAAARVCRSVQAKISPEVLEKKDRSPVTIADFASQAVVCRALQAAFPDDPVIAEEGSAELRQSDSADFVERIVHEIRAIGIDCDADTALGWIDRGDANEASDRFWTIDPIDGTKGFLRKEQYAVSLALIIDGRIAVGILGCPNLPVTPGAAVDAAPDGGSLLFAVRGEGSWIAPLSDPDRRDRIRVSECADPAAARFCESVESGHSSHDEAAQIAERLGISRPPVRLDSQAKYAVVARGEADIYLRLPTRPGYREKIWDHAGGVLVVEEAGGRVSDVHGQPLEFHHGRELVRNRGVIVTNELLHDSVLDAVQAVLGAAADV